MRVDGGSLPSFERTTQSWGCSLAEEASSKLFLALSRTVIIHSLLCCESLPEQPNLSSAQYTVIVYMLRGHHAFTPVWVRWRAAE